MYKLFFSILIVVSIHSSCNAQESSIPYSKIYSNALNGDIPSALDVLNSVEGNLSPEDQAFKKEYELRFASENDKSTYLSDESEPLFELRSLFRDYWRNSLLNPGENYIGQLGQKMVPFLMRNYPPIQGKKINRDSIGVYLSRYIHDQGYYTQDDVDISGHLLDLVIWKSQKDTLISLDLDNEKIDIQLVKMKDFITLGWREYATLGTHYPGGWATEKAVYMVEKAYDMDSEEFKVSLVAHEGRHYLDLNAFPGLENEQLEYRAKLTELAIADSTMFDLISFFIDNSDEASEVPHFVANYMLIHHLSEKLFNSEFETDIDIWRKVEISSINEVSYQLLKEDTEILKSNL